MPSDSRLATVFWSEWIRLFGWYECPAKRLAKHRHRPGFEIPSGITEAAFALDTTAFANLSHLTYLHDGENPVNRKNDQTACGID